MSDKTLKMRATEACAADKFEEPRNSVECTMLFNKMLEYAMKKHGDQKYDRGSPYVVHLIGVSNIANRYGYGVDDIELGYKVHLTCLGHDLIEDPKVKFHELSSLFGGEIAEAIYCLSDELGRDHDEVNTKTWPKIRSNRIANIVKPCDRIFNFETSLANRSHQLNRYYNEHDNIRKALCVPETKSMWDYMDGLHERARLWYAEAHGRY